MQLSLEVVEAVCRRGKGVLELPAALEAAASREVEQTVRSAKRRRTSGRALADQLQHLSRSEARGGSQQDLAKLAGPDAGGRDKQVGGNSTLWGCVCCPHLMCGMHAAQEEDQLEATAGSAAALCPSGCCCGRAAASGRGTPDECGRCEVRRAQHTTQDGDIALAALTVKSQQGMACRG